MVGKVGEIGNSSGPKVGMCRGGWRCLAGVRVEGWWNRR
jgi:hypothetical protein